ncbi:HAMP domain-containing sensor histidine kinase [uncultured Cetobacterium sp.]|uniref:HAMP domain-containing sensor histidine kinase n=1 Tax=uncultured Cetobacterium sp. TaxID=527638 RepID=UPI0026369E02|nr:HAMP domain-containing sensor histidine kinase [uncultured Cetobacterium sp.]
MSLIKIKTNLFTKIFSFSLFIMLTTLLINYAFNAIFLEKFYIYRKKEMMLKVIETAKFIYKTQSEDNFDNYVYDIKESMGIDIDIKNSRKRNGHSMMRRSNNIENIPYNSFVDKEFLGNDAKILYYGEEISDNKGIFVSTSLSVIQAHSHESNIFNIITALIALIISLGSGIIFSRKITKDISYLNEKASKISKLEFPENIEIDRDDEIGDLSRNLAKMSNELSTSVNNLKSFVSNASHELRTPIAVICAHATALLEYEEMDINEKKKYYEIILKEGNEMKELIENLLILSKLDSTVFKIKKEQLNIKSIIEESLEKYDIMELEKDIIININFSDEKIIGDSRILKLVFNNLIQNALKYSLIGGVINIYQKNENLFIENHFEGVLEVDEIKLFQPFTRGKNAEDFKFEGMGLGLSIVAKALNLALIDYSIEIQKNIFRVKLNIFKDKPIIQQGLKSLK